MGTNEIIYKGLHLISPKCKYFYVHEGTTTSLVQNLANSTLELTYLPGNTSLSISKLLGIKHIGEDQELESMFRPQKFPDTTISLNGLKFKKLTYDPHIIKIVIVSDSESRVSQSYLHTTIVVSKNDYKNPEFIEYLFYSGGLYYITPVTPRSCIKDWTIKNFPKLIISDKSLDLNSSSEVIYSLRNKYDNYLIRSIDYQDQFFEEARYILDQYGVELCRYNREETLKRTSYISYRISQTPSKYNHPKYSDPDNGIMQHRVPIDFELRTTNMQLFYDFKARYNNVDLLTNFCEFKTTDKYGERWTAAVKWGRITEDFSHTYESDNNSNFSYQCQFTCELYFYEVYDRTNEFIKEIMLELYATDIEGERGVNLNNI
jgi:hypothetical protein|nr:MAG TPA: hypothetical protein [Caudoviricetes sp.]